MDIIKIYHKMSQSHVGIKIYDKPYAYSTISF